MSLTSIIILTLNNLEKTKQCLESIFKFTSQPFEIIIIDNGSTDGTIEYVRQLPDIQLICNHKNAGFAAGCNQGLNLARGTELLLLNNDTIVSHNWLSNLLQALHSDPKVGMVGPLSNVTISKQRKQINFSSEIEYHDFALYHNIHDTSKWKLVKVLSGFCLLFKREVFNQIGLLDERYEIGNYEDTDYCYRAFQSGYTLLVAGDTFVYHYGHATFTSNAINIETFYHKNRLMFMKKWGIDGNSLL